MKVGAAWPQQAYYATLVVEEQAAILQDAQNNQHDDVLIKLSSLPTKTGLHCIYVITRTNLTRLKPKKTTTKKTALR